MYLTRPAAALLFTVLLISCGQSEPRIPPALLEPEARPTVPPAGASDRQVGVFILEQDASLTRANAKIRAIAEIVTR